MVCPSCYQDYISKCSSSLTINAGLTADTDYVWVIFDKFGSGYSGTLTTDGDGLGVIDISELPEGFLNPHAGYFLLNITDAGLKQTLTIGETDYDCIEFEVKDGTQVKTYLGNFTEETASS